MRRILLAPRNLRRRRALGPIRPRLVDQDIEGRRVIQVIFWGHRPLAAAGSSLPDSLDACDPAHATPQEERP